MESAILMDKKQCRETFPKRDQPIDDGWAESAERTASGAKIRQMRLALGWTQERLAEEMGYKNPRAGARMVSTLERHVVFPKHSTLERLADAFAIPITRLIHMLMSDDED